MGGEWAVFIEGKTARTKGYSPAQGKIDPDHVPTEVRPTQCRVKILGAVPGPFALAKNACD